MSKTHWTAAAVKNIGSKVKPAKVPAVKTNHLTKQAISVLTLKGWFVWRSNNGGVYDPVKKCFRRFTGLAGVSDIIGFNKQTGQVFAGEIKAGKDKLSDEQVEFLKNVTDAGGVALVIRTIDDLTKIP